MAASTLPLLDCLRLSPFLSRILSCSRLAPGATFDPVLDLKSKLALDPLLAPLVWLEARDWAGILQYPEAEDSGRGEPRSRLPPLSSMFAASADEGKVKGVLWCRI